MPTRIPLNENEFEKLFAGSSTRQDEEMGWFVWRKDNDRYFELGVFEGVIYLKYRFPHNYESLVISDKYPSLYESELVKARQLENMPSREFYVAHHEIIDDPVDGIEYELVNDPYVFTPDGEIPLVRYTGYDPYLERFVSIYCKLVGNKLYLLNQEEDYEGGHEYV